MRLWVGVENFAKIESARVCVDSYTLFVGPNNSGKTFLMQLIQGLGNKVVNLLEGDAIDILLEEKSEGYSKCLLDEKNVTEFVGYLNGKLQLRKEQLVKEIFGKEIPIEKLYIDMELEENISYQIDIFEVGSIEDDELKQFVNEKMSSFLMQMDTIDKGVIGFLTESDRQSKHEDLISVGISMAGRKESVFKMALQGILEKSSLFLPASRTGLMLLYRDYFANKTDEAVSYRVGKELVKEKGRYGGLTEPIYKFLRFLQTYTENEEKDVYKDELEFFERRIIDGHISAKKQGNFIYYEKDSGNAVPMPLASAMINEVAPLALALTSEKSYGRLIIDEVEASLHPQKQFELVRFLNRINNKGVRLILSTHSDTFASRLSNLYVLSEHMKNCKDNGFFQKFHLQEEDLVQPDNLFVYEFVFQSDGKSVVKEVDADPKMGFQFDLFTKSAMDLYEEALRLGEIQPDD